MSPICGNVLYTSVKLTALFPFLSSACVAAVPMWRLFIELMMNEMTTGLDLLPLIHYGNKDKVGSQEVPTILFKYRRSAWVQKKEHKDGDTAWTLPGSVYRINGMKCCSSHVQPGNNNREWEHSSQNRAINCNYCDRSLEEDCCHSTFGWFIWILTFFPLTNPRAYSKISVKKKSKFWQKEISVCLLSSAHQ